MDKEMALKNAKRMFDQALSSIEIAQKICDKVDQLLPLEWNSKFLEPNYLEFSPLYPHKPSSAEFRTVCDLVEKAIGTKLGRRASGTKDNPRLIASAYRDFEKDAWLSIWVESHADDTCKITYKRTWKTKAIADEHCLGVSKLMLGGE